jgi:hypothetical protein
LTTCQGRSTRRVASWSVAAHSACRSFIQSTRLAARDVFSCPAEQRVRGRGAHGTDREPRVGRPAPGSRPLDASSPLSRSASPQTLG